VREPTAPAYCDGLDEEPEVVVAAALAALPLGMLVRAPR
jgi:hypothetical protein